MRTDAFDYDLPPECIAQEPPPRREDARLLVLVRERGAPQHRRMPDLPRLLRAGDLLVVNDTRVRQGRLRGRRSTGGSVEVLLLERLGAREGGESWSALVRSSRPLRPGARLLLAGGIEAVVEEAARAEGEARLALRAPDGRSVDDLLPSCGEVPLPPYIHRVQDDPRAARDAERYQTVFARPLGSAAAPTAGLHLTPELLAELDRAGIGWTSITLHVGRGTFQPMRGETIDEHRMHEEWCRLSEEAAAAMRAARSRGGRVVAVGTTVVRTLEARWGEDGPLPGEGRVGLFIRPGHRFRAVDALLTNFHLPRSTLLVLVAAFAGREQVLGAYREAVARGYRFFSYGDAMLVL